MSAVGVPMFQLRLAFVSLLLGLAGVASASVFGPDDRLVVRHDRISPFAPIGAAYDPASNRYGTAFLVDDCHALTAEHLTGDLQGDPAGVRFDFLVGQRGKSDFERRTGATVIASGGFSERDWNRDADWLLLKLDQCLGREFGHVRLRTETPSTQKSAFLSAGYPSDRPPLTGQLIVDPRCRLVGEAKRLWLHTCAGRAGDSGGPLFQLNGSELEVYALQAAAFPRYVSREPERQDFDPAHPFIGLNEAVPIANLLPRIRPFLNLSY